MKQFIGATSHVMYYSKFTDIHVTNATSINIYTVPSKSTIENASGTLIWTKEVGEIITLYDSANYEDFYNKNKDRSKNFRLFVNGECIHASEYTQKYLIEFDGEYTLKVNNFVDH